MLSSLILTSILYQRGIYPADDFEVSVKYGMSTMGTSNMDLKQYIDKIINQLEGNNEPYPSLCSLTHQ